MDSIIFSLNNWTLALKSCFLCKVATHLYIKKKKNQNPNQPLIKQGPGSHVLFPVYKVVIHAHVHIGKKQKKTINPLLNRCLMFVPKFHFDSRSYTCVIHASV